MKIVYVAYSITNKQGNLTVFDALVNWLNNNNFKVIRPLHSLFPELVSSGAIAGLDSADILIADLSVYSHGVGFEIGYCYAMNKNIILIGDALAKEKTSKFILGLFQDVIFYHDDHDLISQIESKLLMVQNAI